MMLCVMSSPSSAGALGKYPDKSELLPISNIQTKANSFYHIMLLVYQFRFHLVIRPSTNVLFDNAFLSSK